MMMGYGVNGWLGWLGMVLGIVLHVAVVAIAVLAVVWIFKSICVGGSMTQRISDPLGTLKLRLAKGEITSEEYQRLKKELAE